MTWNPVIRKAFTLAAVLFIALVAFLIVVNYRSQRSFERQVVRDFSNRADHLSALMGYVLYERIQDCDDIADSRELTAYFQGRDLGMSSQYGLKASNDNIHDLLKRKLQNTSFQDSPVYSQIAVILDDGTPLAVVPPLTDSPPDWRKYRYTLDQKGRMTVDWDDGEARLVISRPYFYKGNYEAQIVMWIVPSDIVARIRASHNSAPWDQVFITTGNGQRVTAPIFDPHMPSRIFKEMLDSDGPIHTTMVEDDKTVDIIAAKANVPGANLSLFLTAPMKKIFGDTTPYGNLIVMAVLSLLLMAGGAFLLRENTRAMVLKARLGEIEEQQRAAKQRNRLLRQEVSDRRKAERSLESQLEFLHVLQDTMPNPLYYFDENGVALGCNEAFTSAIGLSRWSVVGRTMRELLPPEIADTVIQSAGRLVGTKQMDRFRLALPSDKGDAIFIFNQASFPVDERRWGVVGVMEDITAMSIHTEELRKAKVSAEEASRAKSSFLANMSHEIRTPINAIIGMTELLEEEDLTEDQKESLSVILGASRSLLDIVDDILDLSKIESGRIELDDDPFDIAEVVNRSAVIFSKVTAVKGLDFQVELDKRLAKRYIGDAVRLRQIAVNLLSNAVKFTHEGGISLSVRLLDRGEEKDRLAMAVGDTGIGISPEERDRIFLPFVQADGSTTKRYGGTGLGLPICRKLVALMGGEMELESAKNEGSTFTVTLSLKREPSEEGSPSSEGVNLEIPPGMGEGRLILLAEDNHFNAKIMKKTLEKRGFLVNIAKNGEEALSSLDRERPDLILMDIQMPVMDGLEATARIRKREAESGISAVPVIALTAYAMKEEQEKMIESGIDDIITKPVDRGALFRKIMRHLDGRQSPEKGTVTPDREDRDTHSPLDPSRFAELSEMVGGDPRVLEGIIRDFLDTVPSLRESLFHALQTGDGDEIGKKAHSMKGTLSTMGGLTAAGVCASIEDAARYRDLERVKTLAEELDRQLEDLTETLSKKTGRA